MRTINITIVNSKSNIGENCQLSVEFEEVGKLVNRIDDIITETGYSKVDVSVTPENFKFTDDEIETLEDNDIGVFIG
jgi:hypothetical protein